MPTQVPVADGLFTWPSEKPQLIASRCGACAVTVFPVQASCPSCAGVELEQVLLPRLGTLWTWTTQGFLPKNPPYGGRETAEEFEPFGVGYVQLGDEVKVEGRLLESDPDSLAFGMPMETVVVPLRVADDGTEVMTFAFRPVR